MGIEGTYGDCKKYGFDVEPTMLRHAWRLSGLTLAVAILYVQLVSVGTRTIRSGLRRLLIELIVVIRASSRSTCALSISM